MFIRKYCVYGDGPFRIVANTVTPRETVVNTMEEVEEEISKRLPFIEWKLEYIAHEVAEYIPEARNIVRLANSRAEYAEQLARREKYDHLASIAHKIANQVPLWPGLTAEENRDISLRCRDLYSNFSHGVAGHLLDCRYYPVLSHEELANFIENRRKEYEELRAKIIETAKTIKTKDGCLLVDQMF